MILTDLLSEEVFFGRKLSEYRFWIFLVRQEEIEPHYDSEDFLKILSDFSLVILIKMILIKKTVYEVIERHKPQKHCTVLTTKVRGTEEVAI